MFTSIHREKKHLSEKPKERRLAYAETDSTTAKKTTSRMQPKYLGRTSRVDSTGGLEAFPGENRGRQPENAALTGFSKTRCRHGAVI
jgi:hypothetical protein